MERVVVTRGLVGICGMQVCAVADTTDEEILETCNRENPSGTSAGWTDVVRKVKENSLFHNAQSLPIRCDKHADRLHFMVLC